MPVMTIEALGTSKRLAANRGNNAAMYVGKAASNVSSTNCFQLY